MKPLSTATAFPAVVALSALNDNEVQVLQHLATGHSVAQTAAVMAVSTNTVRTRIRRIRGKLARSDQPRAGQS